MPQISYRAEGLCHRGRLSVMGSGILNGMALGICWKREQDHSFLSPENRTSVAKQAAEKLGFRVGRGFIPGINVVISVAFRP